MIFGDYILYKSSKYTWSASHWCMLFLLKTCSHTCWFKKNKKKKVQLCKAMLLCACFSPRGKKLSLSAGMPKQNAEENAVLCSCFDFSWGQCHHCPEDDRDAAWRSRLVGEDSDGALYGWRPDIKSMYAPSNIRLYLWKTVTVVVVQSYLHLYYVIYLSVHAAPTTSGGGLAKRITGVPECILGAFTSVLSCG